MSEYEGEIPGEVEVVDEGDAGPTVELDIQDSSAVKQCCPLDVTLNFALVNMATPSLLGSVFQCLGMGKA